MRLGVLHASREGAQYSLGLWHVPLRRVEYQLFAPIPSVFEIAATLGRGVTTRIVVAGLLWLAVLAALWRANKRLRDSTSQSPLRLRPSADAREWIFQR